MADVEVLSAPQVFREDSIISGYRHPQSSALDCLLSSFQMNNETVNIWTHFLPTWSEEPFPPLFHLHTSENHQPPFHYVSFSNSKLLNTVKIDASFVLRNVNMHKM